MAQQAGKQGTKRSKPSYTYAIVSVTITLFMLGLVASFMLYSESGSRYLVEQVEINLELKATANEVDILQLQKKLEKEPYVKSSVYVSKEEAAKITMDELGADLSLLDYNPLFAKLALNFTSEYLAPDSLEKITAELKKNPLVADVYYDSGTLGLVSKGVKQAGIVISVLGLMILIISLTLIDNTIRLSMYSNRFLIKSMQLVGATRWFIIKPFIIRGLFNGFVSGTIAIIALAGAIYWLMQTYPKFSIEISLMKFGAVFLGIMAVGLVISTFSTYRAVSKYLTLKLDELY
jgi:cell division transport system permease protein